MECSNQNEMEKTLFMHDIIDDSFNFASFGWKDKANVRNLLV